MGRLKRRWREKKRLMELRKQDDISLGKLVACAEWEGEA